MLARLQRFSTLFLMASTVLWLAACAHFDAPAWLWFGALLVFFSHAFMLALEFAILWFVHGNDPAPRGTACAMARAWLAESLLAMRIFNWRQPFRSHRHADTIDSSSPASSMEAVVLVHGFICNRGVWLPLLARLESAGVPYIAVNLEPVFAGSIDEYIPIVENAVRRATVATGRPPVILAHSMGGLVARAWLASTRPGADGSAPVKRVITLGTPHRGTWLARLGRHPSTHQMRLGSAWLVALSGLEAAPVDERALADGALVDSASRPGRDHHLYTCFYSECDNIVMPCSTATLAGADNRRLAGAAHLELVFREEVFKEVTRWAAATAHAGEPSVKPAS